MQLRHIGSMRVRSKGIPPSPYFIRGPGRWFCPPPEKTAQPPARYLPVDLPSRAGFVTSHRNSWDPSLPGGGAPYPPGGGWGGMPEAGECGGGGGTGAW